MIRAVQFHGFGDIGVLRVEDVPDPVAAPGEVAVRVRAAGVNPGEAAIRSGAMREQFPSTFPSGQGTELSGIVDSLGPDVGDWSVGDAVIGFSDTRNAQAERAVLPTGNLLTKPDGLEWGVAATAPIAGATAMSMIEAVGLVAGETVVIAGGAGGVGYVAVQLAVRAGATVIATAGTGDQEALRAVGAEPVVYGEGTYTRVRERSPRGVDAFLDTHGDGQADLAIRLGVAPERVDSIIDFEAGRRLGIMNKGMYELPNLRSKLIGFVALVAAGDVRLPISARFPLDGVQDAYRALERPHGLGKIVLDVGRD